MMMAKLLHDCEQDMLDALDRLGFAALMTDTTGNVDKCNKKSCELVNRSKSDVLGRMLDTEVVSTSSTAITADAMKEALNGNDAARLDVDVTRKGGTDVSVTADIGPRTGRTDDDITGTITLAQKVKKKKKSPEKIPECLDVMGIAALMTDKDGKIDQCNTSACDLLKRTRGRIIGTFMHQDIVAQSSGGKVNAAVEDAMAGNDTTKMCINMLTSDGIEQEVIVDVTPRRLGNKVNGSMWLAQKMEHETGMTPDVDLAEAPPQEECIDLEEPQCDCDQDLLDKLDIVGIVALMTDLEGMVDKCNQSACELLEKPQEEILTRMLDTEIMSDKVAVDVALKEAFNGTDSNNILLDFVKKDGDKVPAITDICPRRSGDGRITGTVIMAQKQEPTTVAAVVDVNVAANEVEGSGIPTKVDMLGCWDTEESPIVEVDMLGTLHKVGVAAWTTDTNGKIDGVNNSALGLIEKKEIDVLGTNLANVVMHPGSTASTADAIKQAVRAGHDTNDLETVIVTKSGNEIVVILDLEPRKDPKTNKINGTIVMAQPQSNEKALLDAIPLPIITSTSSGTISWGNKAARDLRDTPIKSTTAADLVEIQTRELLTHGILSAPEEGPHIGKASPELALKDVPEGQVWIKDACAALAKAPLIDATGPGVVTVLYPVQTYLEQIVELNDEITNLKKVTDEMNAVFITTDVDGNINCFNQCASDITGIPQDQAIGMNFMDTMMPDGYHEDVLMAPSATLEGCDGTRGVVELELIKLDETMTPIIRVGFVPLKHAANDEIKGISSVGQLKPRHTLQWAYDKVALSIDMFDRRQLRDAILLWRERRDAENKFFDGVEKAGQDNYNNGFNDGLEKGLNQGRNAMAKEMKAKQAEEMKEEIEDKELSEEQEEEMNLVRKAAKNQGYDFTPLEEGDVDMLEFNPDLMCLWEFRRHGRIEELWEAFDRKTNVFVEMSHQTKLLKVRIRPSNESLKVSGRMMDYLAMIHKRMMRCIDTGTAYDLRRRMPFVDYVTLEVGIQGPGDKAVDINDKTTN